MSIKQFPGGIVTKNPTAPAGPYENGAAPGIWTLGQATDYIKQGIWPIAGNQVPDAQFNYVTMLLHGDGTNGAQNNTFLDSSTNNFTITRNGNTTQGSFSPYGSNWGNYFGAANGNALTFTPVSLTGDYTLEAWIYPTVQSSSGYSITFSNAPSANQVLYYYTDGRIGCYFNSGANGISSTGKLAMNAWSHIAVVRSGSTVKIYVNGVDVGISITDSATLVAGTIGGYADGASGYNVWGYLSNVRIGTTAVYTSNFTPSTAPLTAITGTALLTCQSNRFIDNSTSARTITTVGSPSVQRFNPFGTATAYSTSVIGGSGYFDGTGDYLSAANNAAFTLGTAWTMEAWIYPTSLPGSSTIFGRWYATVNNANYLLYVDSAGAIIGGVYPNATAANSTSGVIKRNCWQHVAMTWDGTTLRIFVNGVSVATTTTGNITADGALDLTIGDNTGGGAAFVGYMTDVRLVKNTALYTSTFTPPTAPLTAVSGTSLLLSTTNGAIFDNAMMTNLETLADAQISTSVVKFGTGSLKFDGAGDGLKAPLVPINALGGGDFTIELWVYMNNLTGTQVFYGDGSDGNGPGFYAEGGELRWYDGTVRSSGASISAGVWTHIAVCRGGGALRFFINGTQTPTGYLIGTNYAARILLVGTSYYGETLNGYIDDMRVTKGYARYTTSFTPPTAAFPNTGPN